MARFASRAALAVADASVVEGDRGRRNATFRASLSRPVAGATRVCLVPFAGTARPGVDFEPRSACGTIAAGETGLDLAIAVRGDRQRERDESFGVRVVAPGGVRVPDATATGTIVDDD